LTFTSATGAATFVADVTSNALNAARATIGFVSGVGVTSRITGTPGTPEALRLESSANQAADRGIQQSFYIPNGTSREGVRFVAANSFAGVPGGYLGVWTENAAGTMAEVSRFTHTGNVLLGTTTDSSNGRLQLATHTTSTGGIGFGTDTTLFRSAAGTLSVGATTASTSTTTGSLVNAGGFGNAGAAWFGGQINSASSGLLFSRTGASTALQYLDIANTGGRVQFGVETSTGGNFFGGATAYATVLASATSAPVQIAVNAIHAATFSSTAVSIPLTTASTSTTTGSLVNAGGFGNAGAAFIGGNATVFGAAGITINNVGGSGNDSILTLTQSGVSNAFIKNTATTGDIAIGDGGGTYLRITKGAGVVFVSNTTASSSTTTGSLVNAGGFGCAGAAYFGGAIAIGNTVNTVSPTSPNRTVTIVIGGTTYYLHAKTTND
jgi:hypothetical protein